MQEHTANLDVPVLLLVAGDGSLVDTAVTAAVYERCGSRIERWHGCAAACHELFQELVLDDLVAWLADHGSRDNADP